MNKNRVDHMIPKAYRALTDCGIAQMTPSGVCQIPKVFRSYISNFGAAITMGSLCSAVAFFSRNTEKTKEDRNLLMDAIYLLITGNAPNPENNLLTLVCAEQEQAPLKEQIIDAAIALKLAMNLCEQV